MFSEEIEIAAQRVELLLNSLRELSSGEREVLERNGNVVSGKIFVSTNICLSNIRNNVFLGRIVINDFSDSSVDFGPNLPHLRSSILGSTLSDTIIDGPCFIKDCAMIHSCLISRDCVLISNGVIAGNFSSNLFGIGTEIVLCEETGTRSILSHPERASLEAVTQSIQSKTSRSSFNEEAEIYRKKLLEISSFPGVFLGPKVVILKSSRIESSWISANVSITNGEIADSILNEGAKVDNSIVEKSIVGRSVAVESFSVVENSILCEYSKVSIHGKVVHSLLGSYSGVESGECVSSLIGPFVGFHHQSLCIATYWPGGRGNIGYGANVGSNHSGKAPDCELISGEGLFFGLATVVKFPSNFEKAPYSLIASGVTCLPQKLEMPFSLINTGSTNGLNEISPAWVLSDNMFTLIRNEDKFLKRQKKDASVVYEHEIFRPDIIDLVIEARSKLMAVPPGDKDTIYTETQIEGLGKNFLREPTRLRAIDTYSFILRWYALRGLYRQVQSKGIESLSPGGDLDRQHWKKVLEMEQMNLKQTKSLLEEFSKLDFLISANCVSSKTKDDVRGAKIVGNLYQEFHQPASEHPVCIKAKQNSADIEKAVAKIVARL